MQEATLVNLYGLSNRLNLPIVWLKAEAEEGRIPCLRVGRKLLFNPAAVEQALINMASIATTAHERRELAIA